MLTGIVTSLLVHLLLATPVFLLLRRLFFRWKFTQTHRTWWALGSTLFLYPLILLALLISFFAYDGRVAQQSFDQQKWFAQEYERYKMKDDLIESKMLERKSKLEVQQLLGRTDYYIQPVWHYHMGASSAGMGFRFYILRVEFEQDTVKKVAVLEHLD